MDEPITEKVNQDRQFWVEDGLYLAAFGLALLVRVILLGRLMLTGHEAGFAWQAYQVSEGEAAGLANHPAYVMLTGMLFYMFSSGEVLARLLPALVGGAVILFPYLLRDPLGRKPALVAAFGLALDPLLVAYSRQAGSPVMALGFLALALFFWQRKRSMATGTFVVLTLFSGVSVVFGMLVVLLGWGLFSLVGGYRVSFPPLGEKLRPALVGAGLTVVAVGTWFMLYPQGLSFVLQAFPDYFVSWFGGGGVREVPMVQILLALPVYQPLALLFGLLVFFRWKNFGQPWLVFLMCAFLAALLLAFANPARQVWMVTWALVPLWLLAGRVLGRFLSKPAPTDRYLVWGETAFYLVLLVYWWFNLSKMTANYGFYLAPEQSLFDFASMDPSTKIYLVRLLVTLLVPLLIVVMTFIVYRGYSQQASLQGVTWASAIFLAFFLVVTGSGFAAELPQVAGELWVQGPSSGYADELFQAITEASVYTTGTSDQIELVYQIDSPLVHWLLRDLPNVSYQPVINPNQLPAVILNRDFEIPGTLGQFYAGQHHALQMERFWERGLPTDFDRWLVYRDAPLVKDWVVLWTRIDLFPLYNLSPEE